MGLSTVSPVRSPRWGKKSSGHQLGLPHGPEQASISELPAGRWDPPGFPS